MSAAALTTRYRAQDALNLHRGTISAAAPACCIGCLPMPLRPVCSSATPACMQRNQAGSFLYCTSPVHYVIPCTFCVKTMRSWKSCTTRTVKQGQTTVVIALCVGTQGCTCGVHVTALAHGVSPGWECEGRLRAQPGQRAPAQVAAQIAAEQPCAADAPRPPAAAAAWPAAGLLLSCPQQGLQTQLVYFRTCSNALIPTGTCCCCASCCCDLQQDQHPTTDWSHPASLCSSSRWTAAISFMMLNYTY